MTISKPLSVFKDQIQKCEKFPIYSIVKGYQGVSRAFYTRHGAPPKSTYTVGVVTVAILLEIFPHLRVSRPASRENRG